VALLRKKSQRNSRPLGVVIMISLCDALLLSDYGKKRVDAIG